MEGSRKVPKCWLPTQASNHQRTTLQRKSLGPVSSMSCKLEGFGLRNTELWIHQTSCALKSHSHFVLVYGRPLATEVAWTKTHRDTNATRTVLGISLTWRPNFKMKGHDSHRCTTRRNLRPLPGFRAPSVPDAIHQAHAGSVISEFASKTRHHRLQPTL